MIDDVSDIQAMYNTAPVSEHDRLERHQLEHDMTWRYFDQYLPASGTILEIGAATGRYTRTFAQRGYRVTAVDFSETLLTRSTASDTRRFTAPGDLYHMYHSGCQKCLFSDSAGV